MKKALWIVLVSALGLGLAGCPKDVAENCFAKASAGGEQGAKGAEGTGEGSGSSGSSAESGCSRTPVD